MFKSAYAFSHSVARWETSKVTDMEGLFMYTKAFSQDLSQWDISSVTNFKYMFHSASGFKKKLAWTIPNGAEVDWMFAGSRGRLASARKNPSVREDL